MVRYARMAPKSRAAKKGITNPASNKGSAPVVVGHTPQWPPIKPLLPSSDLSFDTLLPEQILTIPRFWTATLCKVYVTYLSKLPLVTTPGNPKRGEAVRVNDRYQVDDPQFAHQLWECTALKALVENPIIDGKELSEQEKRELWGGDVLGLNSNIRIYRYSKGQFFDQHCKCPYENPGRLLCSPNCGY